MKATGGRVKYIYETRKETHGSKKTMEGHGPSKGKRWGSGGNGLCEETERPDGECLDHYVCFKGHWSGLTVR